MMKTEKVSQSIELDCPPGSPRPWDLIGGVIKGTILDTPDFEARVPAIFDMTTWMFDVDQATWEKEIQPVIRPRIEALFYSGAIRWGSW